tara:strand:- start:3566 stop:3757 length:192 start_codon:yes stop_codon:yes gene_type:complete
VIRFEKINYETNNKKEEKVTKPIIKKNLNAAFERRDLRMPKSYKQKRKKADTLPRDKNKDKAC